MKKLFLEENSIEISDQQEAYNELRLEYQALAEISKNDFQDKYYSFFENMDNLYINFQKVVKNQYLMPAIDKAIRNLVEYRINDIDDNDFINSYLSAYSTFEEDFAKAFDKYFKIILQKDKYEELKRKSSESSSGGIIGGGFGFEGAAQGMAIAAGANIAVGLLGGIINATSDGLRSLGDNLNKSLIFKDETTKLQLSEVVHNLIFNAHYAVIDAVQSKKNNFPFKKTSEEEINTAKKIFENIRRGRIEDSDCKNQLLSVIKISPYFKDPYFYWLEKYGDKDHSLENLAVFFGINQIASKKKEMIDNFNETLPFKKLEEKEESENKSFEYMKHIGIKDINEEIEKTKNYFDSKREKILKQYVKESPKTHKELNKIIYNLKKESEENGYFEKNNEKHLVEKEIKSLEERYKSRIKLENTIVCIFIFFLPITAFITIRKRYGLASKTFAIVWVCFFFLNLEEKSFTISDLGAYAILLGIGFSIGVLAEKASILLAKFFFYSPKTLENTEEQENNHFKKTKNCHTREIDINEIPEKEKIIESIAKEKKINAIKIYREKTGLGLKEAKDFIDCLSQDERFFNPFFTCKKCGAKSNRYRGRCPECQSCNTLTKENLF